MKSKKGISMLILIITIIVVLILVSAITITVNDSISNARIVAFAEDLKIVEEAVTLYYEQNDEFPVLGENKAYSQAEILEIVPQNKKGLFLEELQLNKDFSENENLGAFYKIDLTKIDVEQTTRGLQMDEDSNELLSDVFVVSYPSMTTYYLDGLKEKNTVYFSLSSKISRVVKLTNITSDNEAKATTFRLARVADVGKIEDVTVKREVKTWSNKLNLIIEANMQMNEALYVSIDDSASHQIQTNLGYNTIYFNEGFEQVLLNSYETPIKTGITTEEIENFKNKAQEERKMLIVKEKNGAIIGKLEVDLANYDTDLPVRITNADISSNEYNNKVSFKVEDVTSGIKEVKYEYLRVFDENANTKLYYDGVEAYETSYIYSRGKTAKILSDGTVEIEVPKDVEGIQIRIFDKAGNASEVINENTSLPIYIGINEENPTRDYVLLRNVIKSNEAFEYATIQISADNVSYTNEENINLAEVGNGIYTSVVECENLTNIDEKIFVKINVYRAGKIIETRIKEISVYNKIENLGDGTRVESQSAYDRPYVPAEFKYLEGTVDTGYVIQDKTNGNEFVWVPVKDISEYKRGVISDIRDLSDYVESENEINNAIKSSVEKHGGFYIGRYETRYEGSTNYAENLEGTYWQGEITPVIKNTSNVWNYISNEHAIKIASQMYTDTTKSTLVNSYAYDTTLNWLVSSNNKTAEEVSINSTSWGNYLDSMIEGISAYTEENGIKSVLVNENLVTKNSGDALIINSLTSEYTKANNIYDLAGNVYEWTTEMYNGECIGRGGRFDSFGYERPAAYRFTSDISDASNGDVGFRVMLYW